MNFDIDDEEYKDGRSEGWGKKRGEFRISVENTIIALKPKQAFFIPLTKSGMNTVENLYIQTKSFEKKMWEEGRLKAEAKYKHKVIRKPLIGIKIYRLE